MVVIWLHGCTTTQVFSWLLLVHRYTETHQALEEAASAAAELARQATGHPARGAPFLSAPRALGVPQELTLLHCTALHLAATYGHAQAVQALLTSPACSPAACNAMVGDLARHQRQTALPKLTVSVCSST